MKYSSIAIANAFIERANCGEIHNLTPMKLQKLMFYAQSWHLKIYSEPLFDGSFERWQYGPVLPEIYHEFKKFGANDIGSFGSDIWNDIQKIEPNDDRVTDFLDQIVHIYGTFSGTELSWMTHQSQSAWSKGSLGTLINTQDMIDGKV